MITAPSSLAFLIASTEDGIISLVFTPYFESLTKATSLYSSVICKASKSSSSVNCVQIELGLFILNEELNTALMYSFFGLRYPTALCKALRAFIIQ